MMCSLSPLRLVAGPTRRCAAPARKLTVVRAEQQKTQSKPPTDPKDDKPDPKKGPHLKKDLETISAEDRKEVDDAIKQLKEQGVDSAVAQKVLKAWQDDGVVDAEGVRGQLLKLGLSAVLVQGLQTGFDSLAAYCAWQTAFAVGSQEFFGAGFLGIALDTLGWYFAIGVLFDLFSLGAVTATTVKLGGKTEQVYAAVTELAGEKSGLSVVDKAQQAISATKIAIALNSIAAALKMDAEERKEVKPQTLDRLSAMFLLKDASDKYGFDATEKFNLSDDEAALLANTFSKYDTNSDMRLEFSEFKRLCQDSMFELDDAETKAAMMVLDKRRSGFIEFDEFASWWNESVQVDQAEPSAEPSM